MERSGDLKKVKIAEINPGTRRFSVTFKVLEVGEEKSIVSRRDGAEHRVADVLVGDDTGVILLTAWDDEIDKFRELLGSTLSLMNGYVSLYRGSLRLGLGRYGTLQPSGEEIPSINTENNVSARTYEDRRPRFQGRRPRRF
ncbi:MAG: hypothetical protein QXS92_00305 [Thermofilum sp.]|uniref:Single-stranded DNA-binding protein n=1 Tax=Thermofilum pendens TaxID=2269 RepID=A0A7C4H7X3_THEPE